MLPIGVFLALFSYAVQGQNWVFRVIVRSAKVS